MTAPEESAEQHYDAALDLLAQNRAAEAAAEFRAALAASPSYAEARHGLIRALRDLADYDSALAEALRLISDEPDDVLALTVLSILYQHKGMVAEAEAAATRAKLLDWKLQLRAAATTRNAG